MISLDRKVSLCAISAKFSNSQKTVENSVEGVRKIHFNLEI